MGPGAVETEDLVVAPAIGPRLPEAASRTAEGGLVVVNRLERHAGHGCPGVLVEPRERVAGNAEAVVRLGPAVEVPHGRRFDRIDVSARHELISTGILGNGDGLA